MAVGGPLLLFVGTWLHPMGADPNDAAAAFAEYATSRYWLLIHLMQLGGALLIAAALILLGRALADGPVPGVVTLGTAAAIASVAAATVLQAVDGVALKSMVDRWAAAPQAEKSGLFGAAFAVREIEIGLAAMTSLLFGLTASLFGIALLRDERFSRWPGTIAIAGGILLSISGVVMAHQGFSGLAMNINMAASLALLAWMIALGIQGWRAQPES